MNKAITAVLCHDGRIRRRGVCYVPERTAYAAIGRIARYCSACGEYVPDYARYCPMCGARILGREGAEDGQ